MVDHQITVECKETFDQMTVDAETCEYMNNCPFCGEQFDDGS